MRCRPSSALAVVLCVAALPAAPAAAHQGNPNFRSYIRRVSPQVKGVSLRILNLDDRLELTNHSGQTVTAYGYNRNPPDPYVRILGDGTVQVNRLSPSAYINSDRYGGASTPAFADPAAPPQWKTIDKTGHYQWHDHRIHYMARNTPPQVTDKGRRTKIFDWKVPIAIGAKQGAITGELFWQPKDDSGPPLGAIIGFVILLGLGGAAVLVTRRRRAADAGADGLDRGYRDRDDDGGGDGQGPASTPPAAAGEAW